ncbi:hypothetical protein PUR23_12380 [Methylorubrum populi]|uniref:hypothetical protein n=1 Tax=Methylorubrum populi TaxID=223967 RepID=UPI0031F93950
MPDFDNNDPGVPQGLAGTMAVIRDRKAKVAADKEERDRQRHADNELLRQARKIRKDKAAGLTAEMKAKQKTESARLRKQKSRASLAADIVATLADLPPEDIDRQSLEYEREAFQRYLARPGHHQGADRRIEAERPGVTMLCREIQLLMRAERGGGEPTHSAFAERLSKATDQPWSKDQARRMLERLQRLEERGGPFGV